MLVDTNLLIRSLQPQHNLFPVAQQAIAVLRFRHERLHVVPQNLIELWTVLTRPVEVNGMGLSTTAAQLEVERIERLFAFLPETPSVYPVWKRLVIEHHVSGKPAHDARIVAAMQVHGITSILTFDRSGFARYPGIQVISPYDLTGKS